MACGGTTTPTAADFDQSCSTDGDCVLVIDGDICCGCANAAINQRDLQAYQESLGSCDDRCEISCLAVEAYCSGDSCAVRPTSN
jgi:hypothetical protein